MASRFRSTAVLLSVVFAAVFAAVFGERAAAADTLRCDTELVERGLLLIEVAERCGPPYFEMSRLDYRYPGIFVQVDEWLYDLGSHRFRRLLRFENGRLVDIELRAKRRGALLTSGP